ncbi:MAG: rRNA maturation RNase YbeY [Anaerolineae bacterium]|nr:rRNA maturation RNase YbeY [Anaerolineae bacterium]
MIHYQVAEELLENVDPAWQEALPQAAEAVLADVHEAAQAEATLVLTDDEELRTLDLNYLGIDAPTDVLAFPSGEKDPETGNLYRGDVIISLERAAAQAQAGGHPLKAELQLLVVHGMLHLCGFDHADPPGKQQMWEKQRHILRRLGCPIEGPALEAEN